MAPTGLILGLPPASSCLDWGGERVMTISSDQQGRTGLRPRARGMVKVKVKGRGRGPGKAVHTFDTDAGWAARGHEQRGGACPRGIHGLPVRLVDVRLPGDLGTV